MAVLDETNRAAVWAEYMRKLSSDGESIGVTKPELRAAVNALDTFLEDNAAAINSAIPQPARSALTTTQKALLLNYVVTQRYIVEG